MSANVGAIYYTVEADTAKLLTATTAGEESLDRLDKQFKRTDKAANQANFQMTKTAAAVKGLGRESQSAASSLGGLTKLLAGYLSLQGANTLIQMAEGYREMGERIRFATESQAEYEMVQQRLLATANGTYRALSEAQEVYILTADSLRSMGYSTEQALDITDSLSYAFVKNATSADRGANATRAYSNAIMKGKVESDGWSTILSAIPSVIQDISNATGLSAEEVRKLGAEGKLTAQQLNEGLRQSLDSNKAAADGMATTVRDAFTNMSNSLSVYLGESQSATNATGLMSSAIITLGENIDTVVKGLMTIGAGALAAYIAKTGGAAIASGIAALAARSHAQEEVKLAQAELAAANAAVIKTNANNALVQTSAKASAAIRQQEAATKALAAAQSRVTSVGASMLGFLGGPAGIISLVATAAAGYVLFGTNIGSARSEITKMNGSLDDQIARFKELGELQRTKALADYGDVLREQTTAASKALNDFVSEVEPTTAKGARGVAKMRDDIARSFKELASDASLTSDQLESGISDLIDKYAPLNGWNAETVRSYKALAAEWAAARSAANGTAVRIAALSDEHDRLTAATKNSTAATKESKAAFDDSVSDDFLDKLKKRREAIEDGNSALKAAERYVKTLNNVSEERIKIILDEAAAVDAAQKKADDVRKTTKSGANSAKKAAEERKKAEEENIKVIDKLAESLMQAGLEGEALAVFQARASLNKFVTPEQIAAVDDLAKAMHRAAEAKANLEMLKQVDPYTGEQARYDAELQALRKANEAKILEDQRYLDLKGQAEQKHAANMQALQEANFRAQSEWNNVLMSSIDAMGVSSTQAISGLLTGVSNGTQAVQTFGQAVLNEAVGSLVKMGIAQVKAWAMGKTAQAAAAAGYVAAVSGQVAANTALAAQAAFASTAAIPIVGPAMAPGVAAASGAAAAALGSPAIAAASATLAGGRQYGGPVGADKMYRINENGAPEILNTASGRQYLLPNSRGQVVSNKDATASASQGSKITVVINNAPAGTQAEHQRGPSGEDIVTVTIGDIRSGGRISQAIEGTYGLSRRGT